MLIHFDGFDSYSISNDLLSEYRLYYYNFNTTSGRFGGNALILDAGIANIQRIVPDLTRIWTGFGIYITGYGNLLGFYGVEGWEFSIQITPGALNLRSGDSYGTIVATCYNEISFNTWHWMEVYYSYGGSGSVEVWFDGVRAITYTGNTTSAGSGSICLIGIGGNRNIGGGFIGRLDDWYIIDATQSPNNTRLGDCKVETLIPTSNAGPNDGVASAGTNWQCVDDVTNTSDYVTLTNTTGQEELYGMSDLGSIPYQVFGTRVVALAQKIDAGPAFLKPVIVSNTHEVDLPQAPVLSSWSRNYGIQEIDPNTSAAWTGAGINASQVGIKVA